MLPRMSREIVIFWVVKTNPNNFWYTLGLGKYGFMIGFDFADFSSIRINSADIIKTVKKCNLIVNGDNSMIRFVILIIGFAAIIFMRKPRDLPVPCQEHMWLLNF